MDNCPDVSNPDQMNGDGDPNGDVCDPCPTRRGFDDVICPSADPDVDDGCDCSTGSSAIRSTLLMALFAVVGLLWRRKPRATVGR